MAMASEREDRPDDVRFRAYLKWAHAEVLTWPDWKRNLLGWHYRERKESDADQVERLRPMGGYIVTERNHGRDDPREIADKA